MKVCRVLLRYSARLHKTGDTSTNHTADPLLATALLRRVV